MRNIIILILIVILFTGCPFAPQSPGDKIILDELSLSIKDHDLLVGLNTRKSKTNEAFTDYSRYRTAGFNIFLCDDSIKSKLLGINNWKKVSLKDSADIDWSLVVGTDYYEYKKNTENFTYNEDLNYTIFKLPFVKNGSTYSFQKCTDGFVIVDGSLELQENKIYALAITGDIIKLYRFKIVDGFIYWLE